MYLLNNSSKSLISYKHVPENAKVSTVRSINVKCTYYTPSWSESNI